MQLERPNLWLAKMLSICAATILPIVFIAGAIGMLAGAHTDQGGSLLPFVVGPIAMAAFYGVLDVVLRSEARSQERRIESHVDSLLT